MDADGPPSGASVVSVTAGAGVVEGGDAGFTLTAVPAPAADLPVSVTVAQSGDFGAATGSRTVTVPSGGSVSFTVATSDDSTDELDGSVTATVNARQRLYRVGHSGDRHGQCRGQRRSAGPRGGHHRRARCHRGR